MNTETQEESKELKILNNTQMIQTFQNDFSGVSIDQSIFH